MRKFLLSFLLFSMFLNLNASNTAIVLDEQNPTLFIDFDDCVSWFNGYNEDYSEFTAISTPVENCGSLELAGPGYVYRNNTKENTHSCTPGIDSTSLGMCISGLDNCDYIAGDSTSLNFEVRIIPGANGMGSLEEISFYEQAPERFNFHEGASGTNNYPTKFGIRVLIDAVEIYREEDIATARTWDLKTFIFSDVEAFTVTETTVFRVEILPYCLIGNNAVIKAWDIDNLTIKAGCNAVNAGFVKVIGNVNICENDTLETALTFEAENAFGANLQWVLTDNDGLILYLPNSNVVDFDTLPNGIYSIYHLAYGDELTGLEVGSSVNDLAGCFDLSNRVVNVNNKLEPGTLTIGDDLTEVTVCPEDLSSNLVDLSLNDAVGTFTTVLVLNDVMEIVLVEPSSEVDMSSFPLGIYTMVAISHNGQLINAIEGNTLSDISGCIAISNSVTFEKLEFYAGELNLNNNLFCIGDGNPDLLDVEVSNASGVFSQFVITTSDSIVISSASVLPIDLDSAPPGTCLIWNLVSLDSLEINIGESISNISSTCFDISEPAAFERVLNTAGTISLIDGSSTISICVSDSIQDELIFTNDGNASFYSYIITDTTNLILAILNSDTIDFSSAPAGICRIWGVAHDGNLDLNAGDILVDTVSIGSCIDITPNFVEVIRAIDGIVCGEVPCEVDGGFIDLFGSSFCVGDGEPDLVEGDVQGANGPVMQIIVTDGDSNIVALPPGLGFDVDGAGPGMCIVWNAASLDSLDLMVGMHISNIDSDCFDLSQGASFNRTENFGGTVTLDSGETAIEICVGDTLSDALSFITTGVGVNYDFIVTDTFNVILALPDSTVFDFENAPPGICRVWGLAHNSTFNGIVGDTLVEPASIGACFDLSSNFIEIIRLENGVDCGEIPCIVDGGFIDLFDNSFCVGDGVPDLVTGDIQGITGPIRQILVTSDDSIIIALPPSLGFDVDGSEPGTCLVWNMVATEPINLTIGTHIDSIDLNCFDISEPASFTRIENNAGTIALTSGDTLTTICVGDTIPDVLTFMNMGGSPNSYQYVITDTLNAILALPLGNSFDFNDLSAGTCFVYGVSFTGSFILNVGDTLTNAPSTNDCFDITDNFVTVIKEDCSSMTINGGSITLSNGSIEFCPGDTTGTLSGLDFIFDVLLSGATADTSRWLLTDDQGVIVSIDDQDPPLSYGLMPLGTYNLYHIVYDDSTIEGLTIGANISGITGDYGLSNIIVLNSEPCVEECLVDGGMVSGDNNATSFEFCVGDGEIDSINLSTTSADTLYQFVITDTTGLVLDLPSGSIVDFENTPAGTCYIYGLAYEGSLEIALGENINSDTLASDCAELSSNFITVERFDSGGPCQTVIGPPLSIVLNRVSDVSFIFDIKNIGVDTIDVSDYWICKTGNIYINIGNAITECGEFGNILAPGDIKGLNISLDNADGELAIYTSPTFDDPTAMIHYVEWGSSGHSRSDEAISAGLWSAGDFVPAIASGQSIYYSGGGYTSASWNEGFTNQCGSFVDQADIVFSRVGDSGQVIDLENISSDTIDVNDYLIKQEFNTYRVGDLVVECGNSSRILEPGDKVGLVVIPMSNVDGELALFTSGSNAAFNVVSDYVQWGSAGHQHENFAVSSGVWSANDFVPTFTSGQSIYYDGDGDASIDWAEGATNLCGTITKKRIDVAISPNPAVENIAIKIMDTEMPITQMSILNGDGKMMMNASMEMNTGDVYQMGLGSLSPGMYFLRMKSRNAVITERIMIIK